MNHSLAMLSEADLVFLADSLAPGGEKGRMVRVLREDEEILRAMLADERVFSKIAGREENVPVSPRLLFFVLLARVKKDLEQLRYTIEEGTVVFDGPQVASLLDDTRIADYLVDVLSSFVRVHSSTTTVRVRKGIWRRYRVNDLDLMSLVRYTATLEESERFAWYKRIGDLCLFLTGMFPEHAGGRPGTLTRASYVDNGRTFYRAASRHPDAGPSGTAAVLARLADAFDLAVKPFAHMSDRYLGPLRERLFTL